MNGENDAAVADAPAARERSEGGEAVLDELLEAAVELRELGDSLRAAERRVETDHLVDVVRHGPVLEALLDERLDRRDIERRLDVSRATSHRFTRWLDEQGLARKVEGRFELTGRGQVVAEETLRFERNVEAAGRLAPLLDAICDDHQEFVVEPFADATVTVATPGDPYRPMQRFADLAEASATLRGFNTTHMVPLGVPEFHERLFADTDVEIIHLPETAQRLVEAFPERAESAVAHGRLALRTREALPYGLAIFDDRVGVGGYDEETGAMTVFVDSEAAIARQWAERVFEIYRERSESLDPRE